MIESPVRKHPGGVREDCREAMTQVDGCFKGAGGRPDGNKIVVVYVRTSVGFDEAEGSPEGKPPVPRSSGRLNKLSLPDPTACHPISSGRLSFMYQCLDAP
jgi:hypothetical protein